MTRCPVDFYFAPTISLGWAPSGVLGFSSWGEKCFETIPRTHKSESSSQQHNQNIRELIEKMRKEQDEAMWHEAMRQEKRRNETRRERQEREWRDHGMRFHATSPPPPKPPRPDCKTQ